MLKFFMQGGIMFAQMPHNCPDCNGTQPGVPSPRTILVPRASYRVPTVPVSRTFNGIHSSVHLSSRPFSATLASTMEANMGLWSLGWALSDHFIRMESGMPNQESVK